MSNGANHTGMLLSAGGPSSIRRSNNLIPMTTPASSQYDLTRRNMLRSNSSLASTNTVTVSTLKKNQSGDQLSTCKTDRLVVHRSSYV
jgi:hypothetical protein